MRTLFLLLLIAASAGCGQIAPAQSPHASWAAQNGGIWSGEAEQARANAALARLYSGTKLSVKVLNSNECAAFSFNDGAIFISRGLMGRLTDDELAAVVSHEIGHLLHNGVVQSPTALTGSFQGLDIETEADMRGRALLISRNVPAGSLASALEKVADASRGTPYYEGLRIRIAHLRELDEASSPRL